MSETLPAASLIKRLMAMLYDVFLLAAVLFIAGAIANILNGGEAIGPDHPWYHVYQAYLLLVTLAFFGWFWTHGGQSLGMKTWRLKLIADDGSEINWRQATIRFLVAILSWLCVGLGFIWILIDKHGRAWHDIASHSRMVQLPKSK